MTVGGVTPLSVADPQGWRAAVRRAQGGGEIDEISPLGAPAVGFGAAVGVAGDDAVTTTNSVNLVYRAIALDADEAAGPLLSAAEAQRRFAIGDLAFEGPITEAAARRLYRAKRDALDRQDVLSRYNPDGWWITGAGLVGGIGASLIDPLSIGLAFIPGPGWAALGARFGVGGAAAAATGARVGFGRIVAGGAVRGALESAAIQPLALSVNDRYQEDYGAADALADVIFGAAAGGLLSGAGALARPARDAAGIPHDVHEAAARGAVAQLASGRPVDVGDLVALEARRDPVDPAAIDPADPAPDPAAWTRRQAAPADAAPNPSPEPDAAAVDSPSAIEADARRLAAEADAAAETGALDGQEAAALRAAIARLDVDARADAAELAYAACVLRSAA